MKKFLIQNERMYLSSPNIHVCFRILLEGTFDKTIIEEAFQGVCLKHPFLKCCVEIDNNHQAWLAEKVDSPDIEYFHSSEMDWQTWYNKADNTPFDIRRGPLVRICTINGVNTEIIILGHHVIGDGIGYLNLVKDLLWALDNRMDSSPSIPPTKPEDKYFKHTFLPDQPTKDYARWLNSEWRKEPARFAEGDFYHFFEQYRKRSRPGMYLACLDEKDFERLLKHSKTNDLTVNEMLTASFAVTLMEIWNKETIRLGIAASIRNELVSEPVNCMGNYVTGISETIRYKPEDDFESNAKLIAGICRDKLQNKKSKHLVVHFLNEFDKDLIESVMYAAYGDFEHPVSKKLAELLGEQSENKGIGISNLGRHDFSDYNEINIIDVQFIGPAFPANLLTVDVITVNNKLNLCLRYNESEIANGDVKAIVEKAIALLTA